MSLAESLSAAWATGLRAGELGPHELAALRLIGLGTTRAVRVPATAASSTPARSSESPTRHDAERDRARTSGEHLTTALAAGALVLGVVLLFVGRRLRGA